MSVKPTLLCLICCFLVKALVLFVIMLALLFLHSFLGDEGAGEKGRRVLNRSSIGKSIAVLDCTVFKEGMGLWKQLLWYVRKDYC